MGIEPTLFAWEARVLPLNDTREAGNYRQLARSDRQTHVKTASRADEQVRRRNVGVLSLWRIASLRVQLYKTEHLPYCTVPPLVISGCRPGTNT